MATVVLVIHLMVAASLVGLVLLQRSEGGALGMGGGGGGGGGFMTGRSTADLLTRATAIAAAIFFATSLTLAILAKQNAAPTSIFDEVKTEAGKTVPGGATSGAADGKADDASKKPASGGLLEKLEGPKAPAVPQSR